MSDLFDMFFWMARVRMCLHMLAFVCLWFAFYKREVIWNGKAKWKPGSLKLV